MNGEKRLIEIFRALDNRGKEYMLLIAEAELKHIAEGPQKAHSAILNTSAHNLPLEEEKRQNEG